jgi:hypothetical protein
LPRVTRDFPEIGSDGDGASRKNATGVLAQPAALYGGEI